MTNLSTSELERARLDPASVFASPEEVVATPDLSTAEKIDVLQRWRYDATEESVAQEEGMAPAIESQMRERVDNALRALRAEGADHRAGPTKHGGVAPGKPARADHQPR